MAAAAGGGAAAVDVKALNAAEPKVKVALVTGGNKGIGLAVVKGVAKLGADKVHVILTARKEADGAAAVAECKALGLENVSCAVLNVDDDQSIDALVASVLAKHKRVDWVVNNAGVLPGWGVPVLDTKIADVESAFHTNTLGPLKLSMKLVPQMKANGYGRVVNMSSGSGQLTHMNGKHIGYRLSKAGLNVVTRVFADELKDTNVKVNSMCPGFILTDMTKGMASPPSKTPEQGADTAIWLLQHDAAGPNGGFFRNRAPIDW